MEPQIFEWVIGGGGLVAILLYMNVRLNSMEKDIGKFRDAAEDKYVHQDVCKVTHENVQRDLVEIKCDLKKLLHKNGIN